jgi:hypothetical protein
MYLRNDRAEIRMYTKNTLVVITKKFLSLNVTSNHPYIDLFIASFADLHQYKSKNL